MKKTLLTIFAILLSTTSILAATGKEECSLCGGVVSDSVAIPSTTVPLLVRTSYDELDATGRYLASLSHGQRSKITLLVSTPVDTERDPLIQLEERVGKIVAWARPHAPLAAFGISVATADVAVEAYAVKRIAVVTQGLELARDILFEPRAGQGLEALWETGAQAYFDQILLDEATLDQTRTWLLERDPGKRIATVAVRQNPNPLHDIARALSRGASTAFLGGTIVEQQVREIANFNMEIAGDFNVETTATHRMLARDGSPREGTPISFVRGEDLRTVIVPPGSATEWSIVSLTGEDFLQPRRISAAPTAKITDAAKKSGRFLVGLPPTPSGFAITLERPNLTDTSVTREKIDVATVRGITVEEILRNHQAHRAFQTSIEPRFIARNETKLRFSITESGGEAVEATIAGDFFSDPAGLSDWVWEEFYINGVKWKYGRIPELPIVQPEKVAQLPLDIHLTNEYRYRLVRETSLRGYDVYEVAFEPPPNAPPELPLYRGTVWIDKKNWARVRISSIQLNLTGEVLSNEERVDFLPFEAGAQRTLTPGEVTGRDPKTVVWLPQLVNAQQVLSVAGRSTVVLRATTLSNFRISPTEFDELHRQASASNARMVRETSEGTKYLERTASGERVVKQGFDSSRMFLLGGLHHDAGLEFPVIPLGGIDYFNFNVKGTGIQTNIFFAGVIIAANATQPSFRKTRTNLGADFFALALPFENTQFRNGVEAEREGVKALPINLTMRAGHPIFNFGKADLSLSLSSVSFQRAEETGADFQVPSDTFVVAPVLNLRYDRWGYSLSSFAEYGVRTKWEPWGNLAEYDEDQKSFAKYGLSLGKSFYLPKFQRVGVEVNYLDGQQLDRFSKYELGFFGSQRVRGISSGSVRAETALLGHLSYGFVLSQQFRLEVFYDIGLLDDRSAGLSREPFQGVGIGGQTLGPFGTILRLDIGKTIGTNAQDDFVANIVFLKLFG